MLLRVQLLILLQEVAAADLSKYVATEGHACRCVGGLRSLMNPTLTSKILHPVAI